MKGGAKKVRENDLVKGLLGDRTASLFEEEFAPKVPKVGEEISPPIETVHPSATQPRTEMPPAEVLEAKAERIRQLVAQGKPPFEDLPTVIPHPDFPGEWMLHNGGIRHATGKMAGLAELPCRVVDPRTSTFTGQMLSNIDREAMTQKDVARGLIRMMEENGWNKAQAGAAVGLTAAKVSYHLPLLNLPDCLDRLYEKGEVTDVRAMYDLVGAHAHHPAEVERWSRTAEAVTRREVTALRKAWGEKAAGAGEVEDSAEQLGNEQGKEGALGASDQTGPVTAASVEIDPGAEASTSAPDLERVDGGVAPRQVEADEGDEAPTKQEGSTAPDVADGSQAGQVETAGKGATATEAGSERRERGASREQAPPRVAFAGVVAAVVEDQAISLQLGEVVGVTGSISLVDAQGVVHSVDGATFEIIRAGKVDTGG